MNRKTLALVAAASVLVSLGSAQTTGDYLFTRKKTNGQESVWISPGTDNFLSISSEGIITPIPKSTFLTPSSAASSYQPLDSDLTSIAALTTTTFGRSVLTSADAAALRTSLGLGSLATASSITSSQVSDATASGGAGSGDGKVLKVGSAGTLYLYDFKADKLRVRANDNTYGTFQHPASYGANRIWTTPDADGVVALTGNADGSSDVEHGGTGVASLTAYAPIFGGTTTTGPVQSGTVGTAGQVLTSNGAGALPTFQAVPAASESIPQRFGTNYRQILRRIKGTMDQAQESVSIQVIGDSMGDAPGSSTTTGEWVSQVAYRIAALYPNYNVVHKIYDQPTALYTSYQVQTGSSGERHLNFPSANAYSAAIPLEDMITPTSGDLDVRVKLVVPSWAAYATANAGTSKTLAAEYGGGGSGSRFKLLMHETKVLVVTWASSTSGYNNTFSSASFTNADNTPFWARVTIEGNSGGSNVVKFYTSTNGTTWTQLGITRTNPTNSGAQPLNIVNAALEAGGNGTSVEPLRAAKIYAVESLDGLNGPPRHPLTMDAFRWLGFGTPATSAPNLLGSPTLTINNASVFGYSIADFLGLSNRPWLRNDGRGITIFAQGYNNGQTPTSFRDQLDSLLTAVRVRRPLDNVLAIVEPFSSANTAAFGLHYQADMWRRGVLMDWANRNDAGLLDMHAIFANNGGTLFSDDIHPNATGSALWATSFMTAFSE